jgi:hypothetical protein
MRNLSLLSKLHFSANYMIRGSAYPCRDSIDNALVRGAMMAVLSSSFERLHEEDGGGS